MGAQQITEASAKRLSRTQTITLAAATTTLVMPDQSPGTNQVRLADGAGLLKVLASGGNVNLVLPQVSTLTQADDATWELPLFNSGNAALSVKAHDATLLCSIPPGSIAVLGFQRGTTYPTVLLNTSPTATSVLPLPDQNIGYELLQSIDIAAGAGNTDIAGDKFTRQVGLVEALFTSAGPTGGTVQVKTAAGAATVSNAMVPGNLGDQTRSSNLQNTAFAAGSGMRIVAGAGNPGGNLLLRWRPL